MLLKPEQTSRNLKHSLPFDIALSPVGEAFSNFASSLFQAHFTDMKPKKTRLHLSVVLANLYAAWSVDPTLSLAVSMRPASYSVKSRYNPMGVSSQLPKIVTRLEALDLIDRVNGFYDVRDDGRSMGRRSRIWPAEHLVSEFKRLRQFSPKTARDPRAELVILRDEDKAMVEYVDTDQTIAMRAVLRDYNLLLSQTFIDIPELDSGAISFEGDHRLVLDEHAHNHGVHRVFNRSSWEKGGRFYGGWWQSCPKEWRAKIFMNDLPTIEDDFSGLHIVMLYGWEGIDYWNTVDCAEDPYRIPTPSFLKDDTQCRQYAKRLFLMAVNAGTENEAFGAFRNKLTEDGDTFGVHLKYAQLKVILDALREKHAPIAKYLGAGPGIDLMNQDARITETIIKHFIDAGRPILSVHDSYIVTLGDDERLRDTAQAAFEQVTGIHHIKMKREGIGFQEVMTDLQEDTEAGQDKLAAAMQRVETPRSVGYRRRREAFYSYNPF